MKKYKIGYTQGVFDMFHIGHLNLLNHAKEQCDYLIVGVNSNKLVEQYKSKIPVIDQVARKQIVENIKAVDECFIVDTLDKVSILKKKKFNAVFAGNDWENSPRWIQSREDLAKFGVDVVFLRRTEGISSTILRPRKNGTISDINLD